MRESLARAASFDCAGRAKERFDRGNQRGKLWSRLGARKEGIECGIGIELTSSPLDFVQNAPVPASPTTPNSLSPDLPDTRGKQHPLL